jgi:DNA invertase Pin-like site-specific DNA recombinase
VLPSHEEAAVPLVPASDSDPLYGLAYYRISGSKEQKDSALSIPTQRRFVLDAFEREGIVYVDERSDILTGKRDDRPGYQQTLALARRLRMEGKRVVIGVLRLDRFGRDTLERARAWKELDQKEIRLYSVTNGGWQTDPFLYDLDSALAARELRLNSDRVKDANGFIRANGFPIIGRIPWGLKTRDATPEERAAGSGRKTYALHPDEAPYVLEAFERRASGASLGEIHDWVLALPAAARGNRAMPWQNVRQLFKAAVYVARVDYPKGHPEARTPILERPRGKWVQLVPDELWLACAASADEHKRLPRQASGQYLLTGLLKCPRCGDRMCGRPGYHGRAHSYWCISTTRGTNRSEGRSCWYRASARTLDPAAIGWAERLFAVFAEPTVRRAVEAGWERIRAEAEGEDDTPRRIGAAEARRSKYRSIRDAAYVDWKGGVIGAEQYQSVRSLAEAEIANADRELARLRALLRPAEQLPPYGEVLGFVRGWAGAFAGGGVPERRAVLAQLWEAVVPVRVAHGTYAVEPRLTELGYRLVQMAGMLAAGAWGQVYQSARLDSRRCDRRGSG